MVKHVFFDNDGTIVDTEIIAQRSMIRLLSAHGFEISEQEYSHRFPGLLLRDILYQINRDYGYQFPDDFVEKVRTEHVRAFNLEMRVIPGMAGLFRRLKVPKSMVSNGSVRHVEHCLRKVRLLSALDGQIFSAEQVHQPKPFPDVYLHALEKTGIKPEQALVVEDSPTGVKAASSAGIRTVGFLGAGHILDGHGQKLLDAGADFIASDAKALAGLLQRLSAI